MWTPLTINALTPIAIAPVPHRFQIAPPQPDVLMMSGFFLSIFTLLVWMHPVRSRLRTLVFAACLAGMATYAFLQGAWPVGIVATVWSASALRRWHQKQDLVNPINEIRHRIMFSRIHLKSDSPKGWTFEWN
jgi:hypothetical protein